MAGLQTKSTKHLTCADPYQTLPDPVLTVRTPLVVLVRCGWRLPSLTMLPIWVGTYRTAPLPTITTAARGLTIDVSVGASVVGWASVVRVIAVDNGHTPSEVAHTMVEGIEKIF